MKILPITAPSIVMLALPVAAYAQAPSGGLDRSKSFEKKPQVNPEQQKATEKSYTDSLSRIPQQGTYDPWRGIREEPEKPTNPKKKPSR